MTDTNKRAQGGVIRGSHVFGDMNDKPEFFIPNENGTIVKVTANQWNDTIKKLPSIFPKWNKKLLKGIEMPTPPIIQNIIHELNQCTQPELEYMLGEIMSDITQQTYCATWTNETLPVCKEIYEGKRESDGGGWYFEYWQRALMIDLRNKLGYWVELNQDDDTPEYVKEKG